MFFLPLARSTIHGNNFAHFRGTLTWNQLPISIKSSKSIAELKINLKKLGNIDCGCVVCRKQLLFICFSFFLTLCIPSLEELFPQ